MYKRVVAVGNACLINDEKPASFASGSRVAVTHFLGMPRDSVYTRRVCSIFMFIEYLQGVSD